ncbi:metal-dependent hydrolase [Maioricimonas rarisocia]|uniref:Metal-dependent hydrolase n=1 Tax=Maioricimonas rarisocia TaxID=2528026 RepID=A0A517ZG72_9PLAN|nr:MBL fold metallo-hydrolase [Maioricimonas rarisocia]QDU41442.1 metal-dependent hydrolase [Maioricimonas rarisocia]
MHYEDARSWQAPPAPTLPWPVVGKLLGRSSKCPPGPPAPVVAPDLSLIHAADGPPRWTWLGHSSFLLQIAGQGILIDPVFSSAIGSRCRRHVPPGLSWQQLPSIGTVLITRSRPDHLDPATIARLPRSATVLVPRGLGPWFCRRRFDCVIELDWWDRVRVGRLQYTFVPAGRGSRASLLHSPWLQGGGFVLESEETSVYHAGDCRWSEGFEPIGRRFPDLDAALLPVGGDRSAWRHRPQRPTPAEVCHAFLQTGARRLVPMRWGTFQLCSEPLSAPVEQLRLHCREQPFPAGRELHVPAIGACVPLV